MSTKLCQRIDVLELELGGWAVTVRVASEGLAAFWRVRGAEVLDARGSAGGRAEFGHALEKEQHLESELRQAVSEQLVEAVRSRAMPEELRVPRAVMREHGAHLLDLALEREERRSSAGWTSGAAVALAWASWLFLAHSTPSWWAQGLFVATCWPAWWWGAELLFQGLARKP